MEFLYFLILRDLRKISSINAAEMARRKFRDIAVISGMVIQNFPGQQRSNKSLQSSAGLIFKVLEDYDPDHFLVRQAYTEVFNMQYLQKYFPSFRLKKHL